MPKEDGAIALEDKPKNEDKLPRQKARGEPALRLLFHASIQSAEA
jgi:hypothetical protein